MQNTFYIFYAITNILICVALFFILKKQSPQNSNIFKKAILKYIIASSLFITGVAFFFNTQVFSCNKHANTCFSTIMGLKIGKTIKIDSLYGISIKQDKKLVYNLINNGKFFTMFDNTDLYYIILTTKNGETLPFYLSPTRSKRKAENDKSEFLTFIKTNKANFSSQNEQNDFISF